MTNFLQLRHCRYFINTIYRTVYKYNVTDSMYCCKPFGIKIAEIACLNYVPLNYSYHQIREYAKASRNQGKAPKGGKAKKMQLSDQEISEVIDVYDYRQQLNDVVEKLKKDYIEHLSVRSAVGNIENIVVKINDDEYPLNELAVISKKNQNLIAINMSDFPEGLKPAIQAIIESGSGFNPQQDGTMIYLAVPKMTREHRENLAKSAKTLCTKAKDVIRSIQNSFIKEAKERDELSEDLVYNTTNQIMLIAEQCAAELEKLMKVKQKELLGDNEK